MPGSKFIGGVEVQMSRIKIIYVTYDTIIIHLNTVLTTESRASNAPAKNENSLLVHLFTVKM